MENKKREQVVADLMLELGIKPNLSGFEFLKVGILKALDKPDMLKRFTKELYPLIAEVNNSTSQRVERSIRHAIGVGYESGKLQNINNIFGIDFIKKYDRPSNSTFISLMVDRLRYID